MEKQPESVDDVFKDLGDVYDAEWYADAVAWAYDTGVVTGDFSLLGESTVQKERGKRSQGEWLLIVFLL